MTLDPRRSNKVVVAADWLFRQADRPSPVVPHLQRQFGLTVAEAVEAIKRANVLRHGRAQ